VSAEEEELLGSAYSQERHIQKEGSHPSAFSASILYQKYI